MGGKDGDQRSDFDKWVEAQDKELSKFREDVLAGRDHLESESFIDSNFSTLSEGFKNFPSNVSELKARMQQEQEARMEEERDLWRRWTGSEDSPDHIRLQIDRASEDERIENKSVVYMLMQESYRRNQHVDPQKIFSLYQDSDWSFGGLDRFANPMLSFGGACYYKSETVDNLPSTASWGWPSPKPQWLSIDWFKRSPYSPIRLEAHPRLCESGTKWRAAFEDLLSAALDKPMASEEKVGYRIPHGSYDKRQSTYYGPGLDWMLSLQCRGILPPQLPSFYMHRLNVPRPGNSMRTLEDITKSFSAPKHPHLDRDIELLVDEVSIKSGPELPAQSIQFPQTLWKVPDTEQDLYDQMLPKTIGPWIPVMTGDVDEDFEETNDALNEAMRNDDTYTGAKCLDAYYKMHDDIDELVEGQMDDLADEDWPYHKRVAFIEEAIRRSSLPAHEYWKQEVGPASGVRGGLVRDRDTGREHNIPELLEELELMEQQNKRRRLMCMQEQDVEENRLARDPKEVGETGTQRAESESVQNKRPNILSQLTTTQTTRMPDGTVTTKVVLKQKFADGREEEHESVHTSHEGVAHQPDTQKPKEEKKGGWFWS
ncbi:hypothetical protein LTR37_009237 [Vermiconidia calcicola]|uniref:Uncharacterized protein n=1 Tax=Vermiconidia calcicola TaxID=1690605 RepID=A0ACC3NA20_9PEZI|nr:hypothetical protein LTR37_009237 [Vermiconidia calcicola]